MHFWKTKKELSMKILLRKIAGRQKTHFIEKKMWTIRQVVFKKGRK